MDAVNLRNLEQIRELEPEPRRIRWGTLVLASLGGAALVAAFMVSTRHDGPPRVSSQDPLSQLASKQRSTGPTPEQVRGKDLSFPSVLSDSSKPTTALAAVRDERGRLTSTESGGTAESPAAPSASVELTGQPLPAGDLLGATNVTNQPKDELSKMALASQAGDDKELAPAGSEGGCQIQVASFRTLEDADAFVKELRQRGHKAYRQAAYVPDRGLWHRVRIGPFRTKYDATLYRNKLEKSEHIVGYVIDPERQRRADADKESRLSIREHRSAKGQP